MVFRNKIFELLHLLRGGNRRIENKRLAGFVINHIGIQLERVEYEFFNLKHIFLFEKAKITQIPASYNFFKEAFHCHFEKKDFTQSVLNFNAKNAKLKSLKKV